MNSSITKKRNLIILALLGFVASLTMASVIWALTKFHDLRFEKFLYQMFMAPLEGTGRVMLVSYTVGCILPAVVIAVSILLIGGQIAKSGKRKSLIYYCRGVICAGIVCMIASSTWFLFRVKAIDYFRNSTKTSDFIENHYCDPRLVKLSFPENKRNLIFIYLESMETTFSDVESGGAFEVNLIPELTELAMEGEDFSGDTNALNGGYVMPNTTTTMSGMFATTSGLPLQTKLDDNAYKMQESFFPELVTMGDLLKYYGYRQVFVAGSDATFGGRRKYLDTHGGFEFRDYKYAKNSGFIPSDYNVFWGFEDEKLFALAKDTITELAEEANRFILCC